jgi:isopentenyl diphosphate isomerase/L-lactate dehydrogenase-like FMN-dependent dehydrogenase
VASVDEAGAGRSRQNEVYRAGVYGRSPRVPVAARALQARAKRALNARAYAYVAGGAGDEVTQRANRAAFDRWAVIPRVLRDVSARDTSVELFGRRLPAPVLLGPVGALELVHREADLAVARAAASAGVPMVFSNQASVSMEDCAAVMGSGPDAAPRWFQLYWSTSDELVESLVGRAEAVGCDALVVTLDTTMLGWRPRDLDLGHLPFALGKGIAQYTSDPVFRELVEKRAAAAGPREPQPRPTPAAVRALVGMARAWPGSLRENLRSPLPRAAVETFLGIYSRPSITWDDLAWLRSRTRLPILLKGVLHPDDARRALDAGVDGVVVSTHGGRQGRPLDLRAGRAARGGRRGRGAGPGAAGQRHPERRRRLHRRRARRPRGTPGPSVRVGSGAGRRGGRASGHLRRPRGVRSDPRADRPHRSRPALPRRPPPGRLTPGGTVR